MWNEVFINSTKPTWQLEAAFSPMSENLADFLKVRVLKLYLFNWFLQNQCGILTSQIEYFTEVTGLVVPEILTATPKGHFCLHLLKVITPTGRLLHELIMTSCLEYPRFCLAISPSSISLVHKMQICFCENAPYGFWFISMHRLESVFLSVLWTPRPRASPSKARQGQQPINLKEYRI